MDTDRFAEFVSTVVIVGMVGVLAARVADVAAIEDQLLAGASAAIVVGVPFSFFMVYVLDGGSGHFGPWDPEDVVFLAAAAPLLALTLWLGNALNLSGVLNAAYFVVGVLLSLAGAVVVRDLTVGEWPPGSGIDHESDAGPPTR